MLLLLTDLTYLLAQSNGDTNSGPGTSAVPASPSSWPDRWEQAHSVGLGGVLRLVEGVAALLLAACLVLAVPVMTAMAVELFVVPGSTTAEARCRAARARLNETDIPLTIISSVGLMLVPLLMAAAAAFADCVACGDGCMHAMRRIARSEPLVMPTAINAAGILMVLATWQAVSGAPCRSPGTVATVAWHANKCVRAVLFFFRGTEFNV
jgi:hypothetical protein